MKNKILNIISSTEGGGAELLVRELHKKLICRGIQAHAIYMQGSLVSPVKNELVLGVNPTSPRNVIHFRKLMKRFSQEANSELIVHVHLTWPFYYVALASLGLKNLKLIYTEHSTTNRRRSIPLLWVLERFVYSRYEQIICISEGVKNSVGKWIGPEIAQRLVTIPNGARIYSVIDRSPLDERLPQLVSIGSLTVRKNFITVIKALRYLETEIESYTIVGEGPERRRFEQIIKEQRLENKIKLLGWSDNIEMHLHKADIQLIPSLWEGFGLVAVEGMSTGLPVIASNLDGLREVLDESNPSVTLVDKPESVDEWVTAIRNVIAKIRLHGFDQIGGYSRNQAEKFTLNKMVESYLVVYLQVADRQS